MTDEPARARLGPWVMALVRLLAGWLVVARHLVLLLATPLPEHWSIEAMARLALAAALACGLAAFAWPGSYLYGVGLLIVGLAACATLGRHLGLPATPHTLSAVAILAVLAAGEWLTRRVGGRC